MQLTAPLYLLPFLFGDRFKQKARLQAKALV